MTDPTSAPTDKTGKTGGSPGAPIRIPIAEDQALSRITLAALLETEPGMGVVDLAEDGTRVIILTIELRPGVAPVGTQMSGLTGIEATRRIYINPTLVATCILTFIMFETDDYVLGALCAGACGFLLKDADPQPLIGAACTVYEGQLLLGPQVSARLVALVPSTTSTGTSHSTQVGEVEALTPCQREVLLLIARGLFNNEIEVELGITRATHRSHITILLARLDARDRAQLVIAVYEVGLISPR